MAHLQAVSLPRYQNTKFRVTMSPTTDVTGWTFQLNIRSAGTVVLQVLNASFTIEDAAGGIFSCTLTTAQTGAFAVGAVYDYDIWRTNSGNEKPVTYGPLEIQDQQWQT